MCPSLISLMVSVDVAVREACMQPSTLIKASNPASTFMVSVDVTHHVYLLYSFIVQELCESRGGCPGLSVLTSLPVSVDVKLC